ncbi:MAG: polysaccharide deacetylase family protein [Ktedonobacteraceae bacterium]|nr:polysaccharide deacetylase family protein [Ktedonobacteraceae bacterium]
MRRRILILIAGSFYYSGLVALARWWHRRRGPRLLMLIYHRASGGDLRRHLLYLRRHYRIVHLEAGLQELYTSRKGKQRSSDPRTPLVLTFDDGYRDNYTYGYQLARELEIPFAIYLIPGYVDSGAHFWWLEGARLVKRAQVKEAVFDGQTYHLDSEEGRSALAHLIDSRARHATSVAEREAFLAEARRILQVPDTVTEEEEPARPLSWQEIREMESSGLVSYGAHTMNHHVLSYLSDPDEIRREIVDCRTTLEQHLGHPVRSFAYPVGQMQHIGDEVVKAVKEAGYEWAVTSNYGVNQPTDDRYLLKRIEADADRHWLVIAAAAAGLWGFFARLRWIPFIRKHFTNAANV